MQVVFRIQNNVENQEYPLGGATSLMVAVRKNRECMVSYLLGLPEVKVDDVDDMGGTALTIGGFSGCSEEVIKLLLDAGADVNHR